jgi:GlpG protein
MRQIATLADEDAARRFADYLLTQQIDSRVLPDPPGFAVWVCDEDKVERARQELEAFNRNPTDPRYARAAGQAQALRQQEAREEKAYARRQRDLESEMAHAGVAARRPVTILLLAISLLVAVATRFGDTRSSPIFQAFAINSFQSDDGWISFLPGLHDIRTGQIWRLVTPIFIHFGILHLLFNMYILVSLGGAVESARGSPKLLLLVLLLAAASNTAEYYLHWSFASQPWFALEQNPLFGGMSGVLYGLFGYAWMKSRFEPEAGLHMPPDTVVIMLGWFVLCVFGFVGHIANVAHGVGLLVGVLIGYAPRLWRRRS